MRMGQAMVNMQKQQELSLSKHERLFDQMELKFNAKLSVQKDESMREVEALISGLEQRSRQKEEREYIDHTVKYLDECTGTDGRVIPKPRPTQCDLGAVMASSTEERQRGRYDLPAESSFAPNRTTPVGPAGPMGAVQGAPPPGYLAEKINVQKHESNEIGLFMGGGGG
jgi:hypothetical protein